MTAPEVHLQALIASAGTDAAAAAWVARGLSAWLNFNGAVPLPRCLGLPTHPRDVRIRLRNLWLIEAARLIEAATTPWDRAKQLAAACKRFDDLQWPAWKDAPLPPVRATQLQAALFFARSQAGYPRTARMFRNILNEMEWAPDFVASAVEYHRQPTQ